MYVFSIKSIEGKKDVAYVIIGGKKWATMNLGATNVNEYGKLYSWGNLTGQSGDSFNPSKGDFIALDIACGGNGKEDTENSLPIKNLTGDDLDGYKVKQGKYWLAANQTTLSSIDELKDIKAAGLLYSDGEHYLFFPAAGCSSSYCRTVVGSSGYYWSSTWRSAESAYLLIFSSSSINPQGTNSRDSGRSVRPVSD